MHKQNSWLIGALGTLVLLVGSQVGWSQSDDAPTQDPNQDPNQQRGDSVSTECLLMVLDQVQVSAQRDGLLTKLHARMGEDVTQGQLLIELSDEQSRAELAVAQATYEQARVKAENEWPIHAAEAELGKSSKEVELLTEVGQRTPLLERFRATMTKEKNIAELRAARATNREDRFAMEVTAAEREVAQIDLSQRRSTSPVSGTIVQQIRYVGEWCKQGDPVIKILRMDVLMVQAIVNINQIAPHSIIGMDATAEFKIGAHPPIVMRNLKITQCSPEVDLDGNYLVWTTIDNEQVKSRGGQEHWLLRPGISGQLTLHPSPDSSFTRSPSTSIAETVTSVRYRRAGS